MSIPNIVYKAHATGNDFVVYVDPEGAYEPTADEVRMLCERHFGIGGDGLIRLAHPKDVSDLNDAQVDECAAGDAQWFMDYRNADGSLSSAQAEAALRDRDVDLAVCDARRKAAVDAWPQ